MSRALPAPQNHGIDKRHAATIAGDFMGLLSALNLPTPKALAEAKASHKANDKSGDKAEKGSQAKEAQGALAEFIGDVKGLLAAGHPQGEKMRTLAAAAGADAKAGLWDQVKEKVAQGRKSIEGLTKAYTDAKKEVLKPVEDAKKVANADYGNDTPTESAVDPGAAEESFKAFADDVEAATKRLKQAQGVLAKVQGQWETAKAIGQTAEALGKVAEGLEKVGDGAGKVLKVAAAVRKLEECRQVLIRVQAVDFTQTGNRVKNAQAMGDMAKLFGEFGAAASEELPMLKGYFQLISRLGEIWVPFAKMVDRREQEAFDAADGKMKPEPAPEAKDIAADTGETIALEDVPAFLDRQWSTLDSSQEARAARQARDIRDDGEFDENFRKFLAAIEKSHGLKAKMFHAIAENTPVELPGERFLQEDLARYWKACYDVVVKLRAELDKNWNWMGVTYQPAVRALAAAKPKKG
ncbi:MAG: hypothetical protein K8R60_14970 [Burkholderiales bacterium]|nr:hypothetical protein [Burkholderiales bacterium]